MAEFFWTYLWPLIIIVAQSVLLLVVLLVAIAYILLADRKIWAAVQIRRGPNVVGPWGLLQSFADLIKFAVKEPIIPSSANKGVFLLAPLVTATLALSAWAVIPVSEDWLIADINVGILYIFAISSLKLSEIVDAQDGTYGLLSWFWLPLFPMFVIFFVSALAETNRPPFDLVEAESELVAGFMVEYGSTPYLLFMLAEYVAMTTMCAMCTILFMGGWLPPFPVPPFTWIPGVVWFLLKCLAAFFMFAMVKAFVPRYRYDQLM